MMAASDVDQIYAQHIRPLSSEERRRLLALMVRDLARPTDEMTARKTRSILELEGVGAELWVGIDAQEYVNELRAEWDHHA